MQDSLPGCHPILSFVELAKEKEAHTPMTEKFDKLKTLLAEIYDLEKALRLVSWDQQTQMPPGGAEGRANLLATLTRLQHARFTSDELGRLLEDLSSEVKDLD